MDIFDLAKARKMLGGGGVTSWNDLTDKPFSTTRELVDIIREGDLSFIEEGGAYMGPARYPFVVGETYMVTYNGVEYDVIASEMAGAGIVIGNRDLLSGEGDTGEPFVAIYTNEESIVFMPIDGASEHDFTIKGYAENTKKLDPIFYNAPCVYYSNGLGDFGDLKNYYLYMDEKCTTKATLHDLRQARGKPVVVVRGSYWYQPIKVNIEDNYGSVDIAYLKYAVPTTMEHGVLWTAEYETYSK